MVQRRTENPTLAQAFQELRADYNAAKTSRFRRTRSGVTGSGRTADYHYRLEADFLRMLELSRDFQRNDVVVGQGVRRLVDNVIQDGFTVDPQTGNDTADAKLVERWTEWSQDPDRCDLAGELTFHAMERLVLEQVVVDGDIFVLPQKAQLGSLQLIEAHRVRTPRNTARNVVHGVLLDEYRKRLEYWVTKDEIDPSRSLMKVSDTLRYAVRDNQGRRQVHHIYRPDRVSQTRGVSAFAPIVDAVGMHDDIQFAKLVQQQLVSCFAIFRQRELDFQAVTDQQRGEQTTETLSDGSTRTIEGIAPGMEIFGAPGETLHGFSPNVPNPEFLPHALMILTFVAVNLNLPLAVLLLDPTKTNFSGWRGAIDQARTSFREIQHWLIDYFHRPIYRLKVRQWLAEDPILQAMSRQDGVNLFSHRWNAGTWAYIEPLKDASADLLRMRNALISPRRLHAERGRDWQEVATEIVADNAFAIERAKQRAAEINKRFSDGQPVHWRELVSLPTPDGVKVALDGGDGGDAPRRQANAESSNGP